MLPLGALSAGMGVFQGISGLLGAGRAKRQAKKQRAAAFREIGRGDQMYQNQARLRNIGGQEGMSSRNMSGSSMNTDMQNAFQKEDANHSDEVASAYQGVNSNYNNQVRNQRMANFGSLMGVGANVAGGISALNAPSEDEMLAKLREQLYGGTIA